MIGMVFCLYFILEAYILGLFSIKLQIEFGDLVLKKRFTNDSDISSLSDLSYTAWIFTSMFCLLFKFCLFCS
jgi:hypothetical protein